MRERLTNNVLAAINEIEELLETLKVENTPNQIKYELDSEHALSLQATAEDVLDQLNILKGRV